MTPQRTHANDEGIDWTMVWDSHVQQSGVRNIEVEAANDNSNEREPSRFVLAMILLAICVVGFSAIGAIQS